MDSMDFFCGRGLELTAPMPFDMLEHTVRLLTEPKRDRHVFGCRVTAVALAQFWGADPVLAARAALLHDVTKALNYEEQLTLCRYYGIMTDALWPEKTLHALTGSIVADKVFRESEEVCSAVRKHTTGDTQMSLLDKIIYIADYIEPSRDLQGVESLRELAFSHLDTAVVVGLRKTVLHLHEQGRPVSKQTLDAIAALEEFAMVDIFTEEDFNA